MPRFATKRPSSRDPLQIQINVAIEAPKGRTVSANVIREAIRYRIEHGEDPRGFTCEIVQWRNPTRPGSKAAWRAGNQPDAWGTLGNAIIGALDGHAGTTLDVGTIRHRGTDREA